MFELYTRYMQLSFIIINSIRFSFFCLFICLSVYLFLSAIQVLSSFSRTFNCSFTDDNKYFKGRLWFYCCCSCWLLLILFSLFCTLTSNNINSNVMLNKIQKKRGRNREDLLYFSTFFFFLLFRFKLSNQFTSCHDCNRKAFGDPMPKS